MHLILTGATGLVGSSVLRAMLVNPSVTKISILSRRSVAQAEGHQKVQVIIHENFATYDSSLYDKLKDARGCVWAQGISQAAVGKEEYVEITKTYPTTFAQFLVDGPTSEPISFVYVSGEGATHSPGALTPLFGRVKGETEKALIEMGSKNPNKLSVYIGRPAGVDPRAQPEIHPYIPKATGVMGALRNPILSTIKLMGKNFLSPTKELGEALVDMAKRRGDELSGDGIVEGRIATNVGLRRMAGI